METPHDDMLFVSETLVPRARGYLAVFWADWPFMHAKRC